MVAGVITLSTVQIGIRKNEKIAYHIYRVKTSQDLYN
jgi:hypothetical protein